MDYCGAKGIDVQERSYMYARIGSIEGTKNWQKYSRCWRPSFTFFLFLFGAHRDQSGEKEVWGGGYSQSMYM